MCINCTRCVKTTDLAVCNFSSDNKRSVFGKLSKFTSLMCYMNVQSVCVFVKTICFVRQHRLDLFMCENKIVLLVNKIVLLVSLLRCLLCRAVVSGTVTYSGVAVRLATSQLINAVARRTTFCLVCHKTIGCGRFHLPHC